MGGHVPIRVLKQAPKKSVQPLYRVDQVSKDWTMSNSREMLHHAELALSETQLLVEAYAHSKRYPYVMGVDYCIRNTRKTSEEKARRLIWC